MSYISQHYWDTYYQTTLYENIPWKGDYSQFLSKLLTEVDIPKTGNILDVGCGIGEKSGYFAQLGYKVWGFDISPTAIAQARNTRLETSHQPTFFIADILQLDKAKELENIQFDLILDSLVSHFLTDEEKERYLQQLSKHLHPHKTIMLLQVIGKEPGSDLSHQPQWIQAIAQTEHQLQRSFGKYFRSLKKLSRVDERGIQVDTYIFQAI